MKKKPENQKRAALYVRVSTQDGRQTVINQIRQLKQYADRADLAVVNIYQDHETGAASEAERRSLHAMLAAASRREFDLLIVWALDRLTREGVAATFAYIQRLRTHGIEFVSFTEEHFRTTGPAGELLIAVAAWIAQQERLRHRARVQAGIERARAQGKKIGRPKHETPAQADIATARAAGLSIRELAKRFKLSPATVHRRLKQTGRIHPEHEPGAQTEPPTTAPPGELNGARNNRDHLPKATTGAANTSKQAHTRL